jgi:two-component system response regulator FixJ
MVPTTRLVHVVDNDPAVRRSLERLLQTAGFKTAIYETPFALLETIPELTEGCILLDVRMPGMDGVELQRQLEMKGVRLPIILMTGLADVETAVQAMKSGAFDFLEKPFNDERLLKAIRAALTRRDGDGNTHAIEAAQRLSRLTRREREVLGALAAGRSHKEIAYDLGISVRTVEVHRSRMLRRLGTRRLAEAIRLSIVAGMGAPSFEVNGTPGALAGPQKRLSAA